MTILKWVSADWGSIAAEPCPKKQRVPDEITFCDGFDGSEIALKSRSGPIHPAFRLFLLLAVL